IINHTLSWWLVFTINLAAALLLFWGDWQFIIGLGFIASGMFWILFDAIFGKINWNDWHFHGTSSKIDRWLVSLEDWHFLVKLIPLILGILIIKTIQL
ncbi:MAG: hypothetical protein ACPGTO_10275, partial [Polaribacter sp.]